MVFKLKLVLAIALLIAGDGLRPATAATPLEDKHLEVALRMIGHQVLLQAGDSTSRVLPIVRDGDEYRIKFESPFAINPDSLVSVVNRVMEETEIADGYNLLVEDCDSDAVVYGFQMGNLEANDMIPCNSRDLPESCYEIVLTLVPLDFIPTGNSRFDSDQPESTSNYVALSFLLAPLGALLFFVWYRKNKSTNAKHIIRIGKYNFDPLRSILTLEEQKIELTGKEADLLMVLYESVNDTIERDVILNKVWGDEGDYIGRTLDVFVSKLRKKLEVDPNVKIINIRGVGYKLAVAG